MGKIRSITKETTAWRTVREAGLTGLQAGLTTGDFSTAPRDPLAAAEAATPGFPLSADIQQAYLGVLADKSDLSTRTSFLTGLELQDALLDSARRTAAVLRGTRGAALARTRKGLEDGAHRNDHLDDLLLADDLPVGSTKTTAP